MNGRMLKTAAAATGAVALALGGAAIARATGAFGNADSKPSGQQAEAAGPAALRTDAPAAPRPDAGDEGDKSLTGPPAERAKEAALALTGGGTANAVERDSENGATWEVEVTKKDGSTVDVRLDENFKLVVIEGDSEAGDSKSD
jgi:uncharacterized membrane protein YkoI